MVFPLRWQDGRKVMYIFTPEQFYALASLIFTGEVKRRMEHAKKTDFLLTDVCNQGVISYGRGVFFLQFQMKIFAIYGITP